MCTDGAGKELAPVWDNSIAWGGFMATSANLRYQLVNGIEDRLLVCTHLSGCMIITDYLGSSMRGLSSSYMS